MNAIAISSNGTTLISGSDDRTIRLWNLTQQKPEYSFFESAEIRTVAISPHGKTLIAAGFEAKINSWQLPSKALGKTFRTTNPCSHEKVIYAVAFNSKGDRVASAGADKIIKLWNALTQTEMRSLHGHNDTIYSLAFTPNGQQLVSGSRDRTVRLWNLETGQIEKVFTGHQGFVMAIAIAPNGKIIASGSTDTKVILWNLQGEQTHTLEGHTGTVESIAISPNNQILASGSIDGTVRIWDLTTGQLLQILSAEAPVIFSPDGTKLITGSKNHHLQVWHLNIEANPDLTAFTGEWWEILGVSPTATPDEVKMAYRRLAKEYHPDIYSSNVALTIIQKINQAYQEYKKSIS